MDPVYWYSLAMGSTPVIYWGINRFRAWYAKGPMNYQWEVRDRKLKVDQQGNIWDETPPADVWCSKCDTLYPENMMAWDKEGDDYLCGYCLDVPRLLAVLRLWYNWYWKLENGDQERFGDLRGDDVMDVIADGWIGWGGEQVMNGAWPHRQFDRNGLLIEPDALVHNKIVQRYRAAGIDVSAVTNAAYERGIAERARKRKRTKENLMWRNNA